MTLIEKFSSDNRSLSKESDCILQIYLGGNISHYIKYDFLARIAIFSSGSSDGGANAIPFSQLDRESLEFFRAKLIEKGGKPPELPDALATETSEAWVRMGNKAIAHVGVYPEAGRRLTDIFNFESRQHVLVNENLKTRIELSTQPVSFDSLPQATLEKALEEFTKAGGTADADFVLRGVEQLKKNKLS
jgi:hypothetical protein